MTSWNLCSGCAEQYKPVNRKFCCSACSAAVAGEYALDDHTQGCQARQLDWQQDQAVRLARGNGDGHTTV